jgi:hypothetical protein
MKPSKAILVQHKDIELDLNKQDKNLLKFEDYVEMGKELVKRTDIYQARIAFYACRVCQIRHGGRSDKYYTISDYAEAIGVNRKTVQQWTLAYRNVIQKLDIPLDKITKEVWRSANRVNDNLTWKSRLDNQENGTERKAMKYKKETPRHEIQKMMNDESGDEPSFISELRVWTCSIRNIKNTVTKRDLNLAHRGNLMELMTMLDIISDHLNDFLSKGKQ